MVQGAGGSEEFAAGDGAGGVVGVCQKRALILKHLKILFLKSLVLLSCILELYN
jgi:hypothetical protein